MRGRTIPILCQITAFFCLWGTPSLFAQERLPYDLEIQDQLTPQVPAKTYILDANKGSFVEIIWKMDSRDFDIAMTLIDPSGNSVATNGGINYPSFAGAYLFQSIGATGDYTLQIQTYGLTQTVDYSLYYIEHAGDEANREIGQMQMKTGRIGPAGDFDVYFMSMRQGTPMLFVLNTPDFILDSVIGIFDPAGNFITYNDDFFGTGSMLLFTPEVSGYHQIAVQGSYADSAGPYELFVNPITYYQPPFSTTEDFKTPGNAYAYRISLETDQVYDFYATGIDGFIPLAALVDQDMNVIASNSATDDYPIAEIPGFTPLFDEDLYLIVMGSEIDSVGYAGADVEIMQDEEDGLLLEHGDAISGVIGPIGDVDEYRFDADTDEYYSILVTPTWHYLDPAIRVLDPNGQEVFFNDNSAEGVMSILSGVQMPQAGEYRIQVFASPEQEYLQRQTGVYVIQLVTATMFDRSAPRIDAAQIELTPIASGVHVSIPTSAIADDTYPLSATMTLDHGSQNLLFEIQKDTPVELDIESQPDEIFFLTLSDSSDFHNVTLPPVALPAPTVIAELGGMPFGLAIDRNNTFYITDTQQGEIVKVTIDGATSALLSGLDTKGGTFGPNALAFDREGNLFLSNAADYSILRITPGGATETFNSEVDFPIDIAFDENGVLYVAQLGSDTVDRIGPDGVRQPFVTGIKNPNGLAFSPGGQLYICNSVQGESGVYRVLEDGTVETFVEPFAQTLQGMAFDKDGYLYVADGMAGVIYRIDPEGKMIVFTTGLSGPVDLAFGYGDYAKTLFATNMGIEASGIYYQQLIAIPTGRTGLPLPYNPTPVKHWILIP